MAINSEVYNTNTDETNDGKSLDIEVDNVEPACERVSENTIEEIFLDDKQAPIIGIWKWAIQDLRMATAADWKNMPMPPVKHYVIRTDIPVPNVAMERIRQGHIPRQMEDKWFMFFENDTIRYFRSWTGYNLFNAFCEKRADGYAITKIEVNSKDYKSNPDHAKEALKFFLELLAMQCGVCMDYPISITILDEKEDYGNT